MKLFKPQVQLTKVPDVSSSNDEYYLHVVTFTDLTNYRADGYTIGTVDSNGLLTVVVKAALDQSIIDFNYLNPIVHTIDLGSVSFPSGGGEIEVLFDDGSRSAASENKTIVRTVDADEDSRPIR